MTDTSIHCLQSNNLVIQYPGEKAANAGSDLDKRCKELERLLRKFMDTLVEETKKSNYKQVALKFLARYTENGSYLYQDFHFDFEISRLEFNTLAGLK